MSERALIIDSITQVESSIFYPRRGDVIFGSQFTVLTTPNLDLVVKIPTANIFVDGYKIAMEKCPQQATPFAIHENARLNIDRIKNQIPLVIVQKKITDLSVELDRLVAEKDFGQIAQLVEAFTQVDLNMLSRGVAITDPKFENFGFDENGNITCSDLGTATSLEEVSSKEIYARCAFGRGATHMFNYLFLKETEKKAGIDRNNHVSAADSYATAHNLPLPHQNATTFNKLVNRVIANEDPTLTLYLAQIGHKEIEAMTAGAPFPLDIYDLVEKGVYFA